jgi:hypothetical protein
MGERAGDDDVANSYRVLKIETKKSDELWALDHTLGKWNQGSVLILTAQFRFYYRFRQHAEDNRVLYVWGQVQTREWIP